MVANSLKERFAEQVDRTPDATALSGGGNRLTYRQLDTRANRFAHHLLARGAGPDTPVAVLMERSVHVAVALLGIIKAGSHYVPLHDTDPIDRVQAILDACGRPLLVTDRALSDRGLPETTATVVIDDDTEFAGQRGNPPAVAVDPDDAACVVHTSGSTGEPKGVTITHRNLLGLVTEPTMASAGRGRVLMVAPHAFSVSNFELWVPLLNGGQVVVAPPRIDIDTLQRLVRDEQVTSVHLTAGLFRVVAQERPGCLAGVREVLTGGDTISPTAVRRLVDSCPGLAVRVTYGATETSLFAVTKTITAPYTSEVTVPVGRPMGGVRVRILDERLSEVPAGVDGEVYIAGARLARGYHGRSDLTAERFVANPLGRPGDRMYRTGDLGRWTEDGELDLLGRADQQVKILGFRVELAEVEAALASYPGLAQVAVIAREVEPGDKRLAAYLVPEDDDVDIDGLRAHVLGLLPQYLVPQAFVVLDALPLSPNGKVDRLALPAPDYNSSARYRGPSTPTEHTLCAIMAEVLDVDRVGIDDSFFELGGQSLLAMRLISRIHTGLGVDLELDVLFNAPTVASLAKQIDDDSKDGERI